MNVFSVFISNHNMFSVFLCVCSQRKIKTSVQVIYVQIVATCCTRVSAQLMCSAETTVKWDVKKCNFILRIYALIRVISLKTKRERERWEG
jgi:hypothetical protein